MEVREHLAPVHSNDDEIDLFELASSIWGKRRTVLACVVVSLILAVCYLALTPSIYESKIYISSAQDADVDLLNAIDTGPFTTSSHPDRLNAEFVFGFFIRNMQSQALALNYFKLEPEAVLSKASPDAESSRLFEGFYKNFQINKPDKNSDYLVVNHQYQSSSLTAQWLNGYINYVLKQTTKELIEAAKKKQLLVINSSNKQIAAMRSIYQQELQDQIIRLEEAVYIAQQLGYVNSENSDLATKLPANSLDESLLYMRGSKVLQAEIKMLKKRVDNDAFIQGIRPIQAKINYLNSINFNEQLINIVKIDQLATPSTQPIKPKKPLIVALSLMLGLMFGILIALIQAKYDESRAKSN